MSLEATESPQPAAAPGDEPLPPGTAVPEQASEHASGASVDSVTGGAAGTEPAGRSETSETAGPAAPGETPPASDEPFEADEPSYADGLPEPDELFGADELAEGVEPDELTWPAAPGDPPRHRRSLVLVALLSAGALAIVGGAIGIVAALTHGFHKPATVTYRESAVFKLRTGDCVNAPNGQLVSVLPCSAPHQAEVFATFALPAAAWPGTDAVRTAATSGCATRLTGYLDPQLSVSLAQSYVFPDKVAWTGGTRTVVCEVRATSGQLTGSVRTG